MRFLARIFSLLVVCAMVLPAGAWQYSITFHNPCSTEYLYRCKYQFSYPDGAGWSAWSDQYAVTTSGQQSGIMAPNTGSTIGPITRNGAGMMVRCKFETNTYGGEINYSLGTYITSNAPMGVVILESPMCGPPAYTNYAKVCVWNQDPVERIYQVYKGGKSWHPCGSQNFLRLQPGQMGCITVVSMDNQDNSNFTLSMMRGQYGWEGEPGCQGTIGAFSDHRETVKGVEFVFTPEIPAVTPYVKTSSGAQSPYDPGTNGLPSPVVWDNGSNSSLATDESLRRGAEALADIAAKLGEQAHLDVLNAGVESRTNYSGLIASARENTQSVTNIFGLVGKGIEGKVGQLSNSIAGSTSIMTNALGTLSSTLAESIWKSGDSVSNAVRDASLKTNDMSWLTNFVKNPDQPLLMGTNIGSAQGVVDLSPGVGASIAGIEGLRSALDSSDGPVPIDGGEQLSIPLGGGAWHLIIDLFGGPFGEIMALGKKVIGWLLWSAYYLACAKDSLWFIALAAKSKGTKIPDMPVSILGFGVNLGVVLAPALVALFFVILATLMAYIPMAFSGVSTGISLTTSPFGGVGGFVALGLSLLNTLFPCMLFFHLTISYIAWKLTMAKAGLAFLTLVRAMPE